MSQNEEKTAKQEKLKQKVGMKNNYTFVKKIYIAIKTFWGGRFKKCSLIV